MILLFCRSEKGFKKLKDRHAGLTLINEFLKTQTNITKRDGQIDHRTNLKLFFDLNNRLKKILF